MVTEQVNNIIGKDQKLVDETMGDEQLKEADDDAGDKPKALVQSLFNAWSKNGASPGASQGSSNATKTPARTGASTSKEKKNEQKKIAEHKKEKDHDGNDAKHDNA